MWSVNSCVGNPLEKVSVNFSNSERDKTVGNGN